MRGTAPLFLALFTAFPLCTYTHRGNLQLYTSNIPKAITATERFSLITP
jgi:hypothetical protein